MHNTVHASLPPLSPYPLLLFHKNIRLFKDDAWLFKMMHDFAEKLDES